MVTEPLIPPSRRETYERALDVMGEHTQIDLAIEEASELITALGNWTTTHSDARVVDEVADVWVMVEQLEVMFGRQTVEERPTSSVSGGFDPSRTQSIVPLSKFITTLSRWIRGRTTDTDIKAAALPVRQFLSELTNKLGEQAVDDRIDMKLGRLEDRIEAATTKEEGVE